MKLFTLLSLVAALAALLLAAVAPAVVRAQLEPTPILGQPEIVTPLATAEGGQVPTTQLADEPAPAASAAPSQPTAAAATPDRCEPNDAPARACALPLDAVSGPFTLVPEGDQDFFRLDLPLEASIQTVVTVRATEGLDLALSARQGHALVASGSYSLTLAPEISGPVVLRVENRNPRPAIGEQYRVEVRREIVPPDQAEDGTADAPAPDLLENNWSFDTAAAIAVGVVYDLTFACPDPRPNACPGGDHDYLLVPVKAGINYLVATFDLDLGGDTVVELFWGSATAPAAANDDYAPGGSLSGLSWRAPADGLLVVRVAPRNGGLEQHLAEAQNGYRFAVASEASELARKLEAIIRQQANVPTPTATPTLIPSSAPAPAAGGSSGSAGSTAGASSMQENITAGPALIVNEAVLRREPNERSTALAELAPETRVTVRGPVSGLWVSVETEASILPGWVRWSDLRRETEAVVASEDVQTSATTTPNSQQSGVATEAATPSTSAPTPAGANPQPADRAVTVRALDPALPPPPPAPVARVPFTLSVVVAATDRPSSAGSVLGIATPTPGLALPVARVRVQLINVFGDLLAEGLTDAEGVTQLRRDIRPGDALSIRVPAWGVELPLADDQTRLIITIPEAKR